MECTMSDKNDNVMEKDPITKKKDKVEKPRMWKVLILNDDYSTFELVVEILQRHFRKTFEEADEIAKSVHKTGMGIAGIYSLEIAETRAVAAMDDARHASTATVARFYPASRNPIPLFARAHTSAAHRSGHPQSRAR